MTLDTGNAHVLTRDSERKGIVAEIFPETVHAIMTIETSRAEGQCMSRHEAQVHLTVAGTAGTNRERCNVALVTVTACERLARSRNLMSVQ